MTKVELIAAVAEKANLTKKDAEAAVNGALDVITESLKGGDWFDTASHAKATFTASKFEKTGTDRYIAHGQLTLRGVSRPARLPFRLQIEGDKARVSGVTSLDRTAFGVGQGEWTKTDQIPADVKVSVNLTATRR